MTTELALQKLLKEHYTYEKKKDSFTQKNTGNNTLYGRKINPELRESRRTNTGNQQTPNSSTGREENYQ